MNGTLILEFAARKPEEARQIFEQVIEVIEDPDRRAHLEILREWACNPQFRRELSDFVWAINNP